jgi:hypothetical protein
MLTCFIKNYQYDGNQYVALYSLLLLPVLYSIYYIYAFWNIFQMYRVQTNTEYKKLIIKYLIYSLMYMIFYFPIIILYMITINDTQIYEEKATRWWAYVLLFFKIKYCSIFTIIINPILAIMRIIEGYVKFSFKAIMPVL